MNAPPSPNNSALSDSPTSPPRTEQETQSKDRRDQLKKLPIPRNDSRDTLTTHMTSTTSLMSTSFTARGGGGGVLAAPARDFDGEEKQEIAFDGDASGATDLAELVTAVSTSASTSNPPTPTPNGDGEGEFKPAAVRARRPSAKVPETSARRPSDKLAETGKSMAIGDIEAASEAAKTSAGPPARELHNSLSLTDVFRETNIVRAKEAAERRVSQTPGSTAADAAATSRNHGSSQSTCRAKNHNSSSSQASDESSIFLDVSWGSNHFDKALLLSSFDDMLAHGMQDGRRIGAGRVGSSFRSPPPSTASSAGNKAPSDVSSRSGVSASTSNRSGAGGTGGMGHSASRRGGAPPSRVSPPSRRSGGEGTAARPRRLTIDPDDDNNPGMIPPVFKTKRRDSKFPENNSTVVHVDGGGDRDIGANLGFRDSKDPKDAHRGEGERSKSPGKSKDRSKSLPGILKRGPGSVVAGIPATMGMRRASSESRHSSDSSSRRLRRASNASSSSDHLTGFQVLTASYQAAKQQGNLYAMNKQKYASTLGDPNVSDRSNSNRESVDLNMDGADIHETVGSRRSMMRGVQRHPSESMADYEIRSVDDPRSPDRRGHPHPHAHDARNSLVTFRRGDSKDGADDSGREGRFSLVNSEGEEVARGGGSDDSELMAEVGGVAYLKAGRSVWKMRIIVVMTFVLVSIIVTVLTHIFFRQMETDVVQDNFSVIAKSLAFEASRSLQRKAASVRALSAIYTGMLGTYKRGPNHPPSVLLSKSAEACADRTEIGADWKASWANVTLPGYNEIGSAMLEVSESRAVVFAPLLWGDDEVQGWNEYAADNSLPLVKEIVDGGIKRMKGVKRDLHLFNGASTSHPPPKAVPAWQIAPADVMDEGIMWDYYSFPPYRAPINRILDWEQEKQEGEEPTNSGRRSLHAHEQMASGELTAVAAELISCDEALRPLDGDPAAGTNAETRDYCSAVFYPVYEAFASNGEADTVGVVAEMFSWSDVLKNVIHSHEHQFHEVRVVVESRLRNKNGEVESKAVTYEVNHNNGATLIGEEKVVEEQYGTMIKKYKFSFPGDNDLTYCFEIYPTDGFSLNQSISKKPMYLCVIFSCFFFLSIIVFFVYDYLVNHRQKVVVQSAAQTARIVRSLYPQFVRESMFKQEGNAMLEDGHVGPGVEASNTNTGSTAQYDEDDTTIATAVGASGGSSARRRGLGSKVSDFVDTPATQLRRFLTHPMPSREYDYGLCTEIGEMEPIAEVFEKTTVMLADIEGFTAWCSEREPSQVFRLLETVYREFDIEARKLGVFKVETVGDCYVAVTGLPDPRDDHAIVIAKYAVRCLLKFNVLTKRLEANLGPGTASLGMRFGLHSGPVTAGVLRGEKSRFQLFGDTINVASRMESTGEKNMIQVSQDTADILEEAGKGHWLKPREEPVSAKGKGAIHTYWLQPNRRRPSMRGSLRDSMGDGEGGAPSVSLDRALRQSWKCIGIDNDSLVAKERLIRWNAAILESFLLKIVDNRNAHCPADDLLDQFVPSEEDKVLSFSEKLSEKIMFPDVAYRDDYYGVTSDIAISSEAQIELLEYVARIASMYRDVPFHNFDHASHVTMSANKLLNRVCATFEDEEEDIASVAARTFGISADPLAQFVVVFSSLVHDVDHQGVPNAQLVKENDPLAKEFENRSVAEKRSIAVAWNVLMEDRFRELQSLIFVNGNEMRRFKQLLINTVLATDIADKERSRVGKIRWQRAFHPSQSSHNAVDAEMMVARLDETNMRSLKATLVFEQIMQASDVAHTMQHWETFKKWNKRLYTELSKGYREGRGAGDPRENWYNGEIGFFDFYIIPLAKKLKECGVFGSAASEYLDYAVENRRRWAEEGGGIAQRMIAENDALVAEEERQAQASEEGSKVTNDEPGSKDEEASPPSSPKDDDGVPNEEVLKEEEKPSPRSDAPSSPSDDDPGELV